MLYIKPLDASWIKSWSNWQRFNLEVVVPKRREGSSPFERTISSFNDLGFLGGKVTSKVTPFSLTFIDVRDVY